MRSSHKILAAAAGLTLGLWSALALAVQAAAILTLPAGAKGVPGAAAVLATLNRLEPWVGSPGTELEFAL